MPVGGIPYQMTGNALGFFLQIFLLDVVQLEPFHASLILFLGRAWDAVTDPAVGFLVSKSPRRKFGKLIPWIACSTPFGVLCYCLLWSTLADGAPASLKFLWYLFTYNFFQICMTCYHVPYSSLTMFLGGTQRDRDSATAYRMGLEVFSTLLGSGIQGQMVGASHGRLTHGCSLGNGSPAQQQHPQPRGLAGGHAQSLRVCLPGAGLHLLPLLSGSGFRGQGAAGAPQPPGEGWAALHPLPEDDRGTQTLHPAALWLPLSPPWPSRSCRGFLLSSVPTLRGWPGNSSIWCSSCWSQASLSIPFWQWFLGRFGKKTAVTVGLALIIPALVAITQVSHNFLAFILLMMVAGCSMAVLYLLPWSMLPDAVDDFMLRNPSCLNLEALFYSFYVFFNKFAGGLAVGISTLGLHFAGYRAGDCTYNPSVTLALKLLMAPVPITLLLIAITLFCLHPINEERRKQMRTELEAMGRRQARRGSSEHHQG
uniref:Sodium-dependent lysophosphatidylcholine symporter 1 n=1 Tax=Anas platyrhynchos TaxID=8839 RepID=A0A8B9ZHP2_ANAPL